MTTTVYITVRTLTFSSHLKVANEKTGACPHFASSLNLLYRTLRLNYSISVSYCSFQLSSCSGQGCEWLNASRCAPQKGRDAPRQRHVRFRRLQRERCSGRARADDKQQGLSAHASPPLDWRRASCCAARVRASAATPPHVPIVLLRVTHYSLSDFERIELNVRNPNPTIVL